MARLSAGSVAHIHQSTFDQIEDYINDLESTKQNVRPGMEILTMMLAYTNQSFAQEMSRGPVDPRMTNPKAAWRIPVRRITGRYYRGWKTKRLKPGLWMVYNESREAYFIEYGIHPTGSIRTTRQGRSYVMRVRRPIGKMSVIKTLRFIDSTRVSDRVLEAVTEPMRPNRKYYRRGSGIAISGMTQRLNYNRGRGL